MRGFARYTQLFMVALLLCALSMTAVKANDDEGNFFSEAVADMEQVELAKEMLVKVLQNFPVNVLEARIVGKPAYDGTAEKVMIDVELSINKVKYTGFIYSLKSALSKIALTHNAVIENSRSDGNENVSLESFYHTNRSKYFFHPGDSVETFHEYGPDRRKFSGDHEKSLFYLCTGINDDMTKSTWDIFEIHREIADFIVTSLKYPELSVEIVDGNDSSIARTSYTVFAPFSLGVKFDNVPKQIWILPLLSSDSTGDGFITPGRNLVKTTFVFSSVSPDDLRRMHNVVYTLRVSD